MYALAPREFENEWSATEISRQLDMPVQTVHRLLSTLAQFGFVTKNEQTKKFRLGLSLVQLGFLVWDNMSIRTVAHPVMEDLAKQCKESVYLTVREGSYGVFVDLVDSPQMLRIAEPIGLRLPLNTGASKRIILAFLPTKQREHVIDEILSHPETTSGLLDRDKLQEELTQIRQQGFSVSYGETTEGTAGVAAPILAWDNKVVGAISLAGPDTRFINNKISEMIHWVKRSAALISEDLGWVKPRSPR